MKTTEIPFEGKYINGKALEKLYDFTENKFLSKTSPGIGVTTALLNYTGGNLIIISPLIPMILKKAEYSHTYKSDFPFFKCNELSSKWSEVLGYLYQTPAEKQNMIINTTPDSLAYLYESDEDLFLKLAQFHIVIDEYDTVVMQSELRAQCGRFLELVFNKWKSTFTLTTATPNYSYLDVPKDKKINIYTVGRSNESSLTIGYSKDFQDLAKFIASERENGNNVAVFSNNLNIHKKEFTRLQKSMVGESLSLKLEYYKVNAEKMSSHNPFDDADVVVFSGRFFIGYDIEDDVSVVMISEAKNPATKIGINMAVQALHRCRGHIKNVLYINTGLSKRVKPLPSHLEEQKKNFFKNVEHFTQQGKLKKYTWQVNENEPITPELLCNRSKLAADSLNQIYWYELHMPNVIEKRFKDFNIFLRPYESPDIEIAPAKTIKFNERIMNTMNDEIHLMSDKYDNTKRDLRFHNQGNHNADRVMERLTGLVIKIINNTRLFEKLEDPKIKQGRFYDFLDRFLQANFEIPHLNNEYVRSEHSLRGIDKLEENLKPEIDFSLLSDWYLFYAAYKVKKNDFPDSIKRYFLVRKLSGDWENLKEFELDKKNRHNLAYRKVRKLLNSQIGALTETESEKVKEIIKLGYENKDSMQFQKYTSKTIKRTMLDAIYYFINPNIKVSNSKNREYTPLTKLPKIYRSILPFKYVLVDIISANAQFVDKFLDTNLAPEVYDNICNNQNLPRPKAKKLYNHILNKHDLSRNEAIHFYIDICGYNPDAANRLSTITSGVPRGSFYKKMTYKESNIIYVYKQEFDDTCLRIHDGVVISPWSIKNPLPLSINGIKFKASYFINDSEYKGRVLNENIERNSIW